jgi:hypothetical protein
VELAKSLVLRKPGSANRWYFTSYAVKTSIEDYAELNDPASELVYLIQDQVSAERFRALVNDSSGLDQVEKPNFHFLTPEERKLLEEAIGSKQLADNQANGMCCIAHYSVQSVSGYSLSFEADIEDDGACIDLRTPYDYRDGKFLNLNDCMTDSWVMFLCWGKRAERHVLALQRAVEGSAAAARANRPRQPIEIQRRDRCRRCGRKFADPICAGKSRDAWLEATAMSAAEALRAAPASGIRVTVNEGALVSLNHA